MESRREAHQSSVGVHPQLSFIPGGLQTSGAGLSSQMCSPYLRRERTLGEGGLGRHQCPKTCSEGNSEVWLHGTVDQTTFSCNV